MEATEEDEFSIFPLLSAEKLSLIVVREFLSVSVPAIVVMDVPRAREELVSNIEKDAKLYKPKALAIVVKIVIPAVIK